MEPAGTLKPTTLIRHRPAGGLFRVTRSTAVAPPLEPTTVHAPEHDQSMSARGSDALPVVTVYDALAFLVELDHDVVAELDG